MFCVKCGEKLRQVDSVNVGNDTIYREKVCNNCGERLYTKETPVEYSEYYAVRGLYHRNYRRRAVSRYYV